MAAGLHQVVGAKLSCVLRAKWKFPPLFSPGFVVAAGCGGGASGRLQHFPSVHYHLNQPDVREELIAIISLPVMTFLYEAVNVRRSLFTSHHLYF